MCLIIHNPKAKPVSYEIIDQALWTNPDGFGIFYHDTGEIVRTMSADKVYDLIDTDEPRPYTAHFRYATSGTVGVKQCHPFDIDKRYSLIMNGTINRLVSKKSVDTEELCKLLAGLREDRILGLLATYACRFVLLDRKTGAATMVNRDLWTTYEGVHYSKDNCLPKPPSPSPPKWNKHKPSSCGSNSQSWYWSQWDNEAWQRWSDSDPPTKGETVKAPAKDNGMHTVAVYGTLKSGFGNHHLLADSYSLGDGHTVDPYPMIVNGIPYLIDDAGTGHRVTVEVYRVTDDTLAHLDSLEGHPNWYVRRKMQVQLVKGGTVSAWVYTIPKSKRYTHTGSNSTDYVACY